MRTQLKHILTNRQLLATCIKYGLIGCTVYSGFFLLMRMVGLAHFTELRFFNYAVMCLVSFYALKQATVLNSRQPTFFMDMAIIFVTCVLSFVFFGMFIFIYSVFDPFIMETFTKINPGSLAFGRYSAPFFIVAEGFGLSSVVALGMTFFFRSLRERRNVNGEIPREFV